MIKKNPTTNAHAFPDNQHRHIDTHHQEKIPWIPQGRYYEDKLSYEIDSWDLKVAMEARKNIIIDARAAEAQSAIICNHLRLNLLFLAVCIGGKESWSAGDRTSLVYKYCDANVH